MSNIKNQLEDFFSEDKNIPSEYSWEVMAAGIQDKMNETKRRKPLVIWFLVFAVSASLLFWSYSQFDKQNLMKRSAEMNTVVQSLSKIDTTTNSQLLKSNLKAKQYVENSNNNIQSTVSFYSSEQVDNFNRSNYNVTTNNLDLVELKNYNNSYKINQIEQLNPKSLIYEEAILLDPIKPFITIDKEEFRPIYTIAIDGGLTLMGDDIALNNNSPYTKLFPAWNSNISAQYRFKKNHLIEVSYGIAEFSEKFRFKRNESYQENLENQVLVQYRSSITGNILNEVIGDELVDVNRYRNILVYNTYRMHRFGVGYSYHIPFSSKQFIQVGASLNYNLIASADGIKLDYTDETIELTKDRLRDGFFTSGIVGKYGYHLNEKWSVFGRIGFQYSLQSIHNDKFADTRPYLIRGNIGVQYRLN